MKSEKFATATLNTPHQTGLAEAAPGDETEEEPHEQRGGEEGLPGAEEPTDAFAGEERTHTIHPRGGEEPGEDEKEGLG